jgi:hypothetical protein
MFPEPVCRVCPYFLSNKNAFFGNLFGRTTPTEHTSNRVLSASTRMQSALALCVVLATVVAAVLASPNGMGGTLLGMSGCGSF